MRMRVLDDRFELVERLGGGGMGLVWRARDLALHRDVAIKEVRPPEPAMSEEVRGRVMREARALASLNHPNVVTIHHIVQDEYPWIVMELVEGGSLQDRLARGPMAPWEAARLGREVLSALRAAHSVGILHRDVKPANVLLRPDGTSVLTDFGIAAMLESPQLTATGAFIGSPEYIAPERANGLEGHPASDLWSLGLLLYVAVEGHNPMRRETALATLAAVLNQPIPPAHRAGPLAPVIGALLQRDPGLRPDHATLDRMLAAAESGSTTMPATVRRAKRGGGLTAAVVAGSLAVVATLGVVGWKLIPETSKPTPTRNAVTLPSRGFSTPSQEPERVDLLAPDGLRTAVAALVKKAGTSKIYMMTIYPEHISVQAAVRGERGVYQTYSYRDGEATKDVNFVGPATTSPVDLKDFRWDKVPDLLRAAETTLGVKKAKSRYIIINPVFSRTGLMVYVSDKYNRSGYLVGTVDGKVVRRYPV